MRRILLAQGANVGRSDPDGFTSLHLASENGHLDAVRLLVDAGADIEVRMSVVIHT